MTRTFETFDEASRFIREMQEQGRHAEMLDPWDGRALSAPVEGGVRVRVVDPEETEDESEDFFSRGVRNVVIGLITLGFVSIGVLAMTRPIRTIHLVAYFGTILVVSIVGGWVITRILEKCFPNRR